MSFLKDIKTSEEIAAERLENLANSARAMRDALIKETDFYMLPDYPNFPQGITEYRQALRDITGQPGFPHSIDWPMLPASVSAGG